MRTILAGAAAAWFIWLAAMFEAPGVYHNDGQPGGLDGDPGALAVTSAVRMLAVGLALVALALVNWGYLYDEVRGLHEPAVPAGTTTTGD
jgi:hypothetical protein